MSKPRQVPLRMDPADAEERQVLETVGGLLYATDGDGMQWVIPIGPSATRRGPGGKFVPLIRLVDIPRPLRVTEIVVIEDAG